MKQLSVVLLALGLAACGGGGDTSSDAGNESQLAATSSPESGSSSSSGSSGSSGTATNSSSKSGTASDSSGPDGTYRGQITATLSGEGVLPVTDSTDLVIEISGSEVTAIAEGRTYEGDLDGDSFTVKIPIDEESRGITCQGTPVLDGTVANGIASGTVLGEGKCFSDKKEVPVEVTGEFSTRK